MSRRILLRCPLLLMAVHARAQDAPVLRENGTELRIEVVGVVDQSRTDMLHRWAAEAARTTLTSSGRFPLQHARVRISQRAGRGDSHAELGLGKSGTTLHFSRNDAGARLRGAIMSPD